MLLDWSMGGAAVIEAAARLVSPALLPGTVGAAQAGPAALRGVITLASQAAGLYRQTYIAIVIIYSIVPLPCVCRD